ncbi:MAG: class I SAM-dependent methyltransferase [Ardenticatenaceae bacterium]|nr:class I SAM-dependent methyltransferase [Ardenticatenaceae bacterium]MCB9445763.1 class I SAM-dependent methyltransferase [Ardenticatenaceae bacterium]
MYDQIAHYYDLTHANLTDDIDFVLALAQNAHGPILELGCGSGRLLLPLARAGYDVNGVDNSAAMLARACTALQNEPPQVQGRVTLLQADMTAVNLENGRFALAIIPYNTFLHLDSAQKAAALKRIRHALMRNGRLFIDLINPFAMAATPNDHTLSLENSFTDPQTGDTVLQMASNHLDELSQQLRITWIYDASPPDGGPIHRTVTAADYYYLFPHQIELLLQEAGFQLLTLFGDYDQSSFTEESERLLVTAVLV